MKLLTKEIKKQLPKIYETESVKLKDKKIICKFFNPCGAGTWYAVEGQQEENDYAPSRSGAIPLKLLEGFNGAIQVDGYDGYSQAIEEYNLIRLGC